MFCHDYIYSWFRVLFYREAELEKKLTKEENNKITELRSKGVYFHASFNNSHDAPISQEDGMFAFTFDKVLDAMNAI